MILLEAASMVQIPKPVDGDTLRTLKLFQQVLAIVFESFHGDKYGKDKRGELGSLKKFKEYKKKISQYKDVPFVRPIFNQIQDLNRQFIDKHQATRQTRSINIQPQINQALQAWKSRNVNAILTSTQSLKQYTRALTVKTADPLRTAFNPLYIENPLFFISNRFLEVFEQAEIEEVINMDLNTRRYSYLPLPKEKQSNFEYIAYYMLRLRNNDSPVTITGSDVRKYLDMAYSGSDYEQLITMVQNYLHNNDKTLIPKILTEIEKYPEIRALNDQAKQEIKLVYRGVGGEPSSTKVLAIDRKNRFVATSTSKRAATNFALQIGHLESKDSRRVEDAALITYTVGPDAVLLDTTIFGGVFGEGEVLIDATKAGVEDVEFL